MKGTISHDRREETIEEKTLWFRTLPISERMEMLCFFTDLALTINPKLQDIRRAQQTSGSVQVISSKKAAGRDIDLEDVRLLELPDKENNS